MSIASASLLRRDQLARRRGSQFSLRGRYVSPEITTPRWARYATACGNRYQASDSLPLTRRQSMMPVRSKTLCGTLQNPPLCENIRGLIGVEIASLMSEPEFSTFAGRSKPVFVYSPGLRESCEQIAQRFPIVGVAKVRADVPDSDRPGCFKYGRDAARAHKSEGRSAWRLRVQRRAGPGGAQRGARQMGRAHE